MNGLCLALVLLCVSISSCSSDSLPTQALINNVVEFQRALEMAGEQVESADRLAPELPGGDGRSWEIREDVVYIYSFTGQEARELAVNAVVSGEAFRAHATGELQIWERRTFLVIYPGSDGGMVLLLSGLLGDPESRQLTGPDEPYPPAISAAQHVLADELGLSPVLVKVVDYESVIWPDSCLGLVGEGEACAQVETPGWRIRLSAQDEDYTLHSDSVGNVVEHPEQ